VLAAMACFYLEGPGTPAAPLVRERVLAQLGLDTRRLRRALRVRRALA
jgi:hypothetical protein